MKCPVCSAELPSTAKFCGGCGATITAATPPKPVGPPPEPKASTYVPPKNAMTPSFSPSYSGSAPPAVEKKYRALRLIAVLYKIFGFVAAGVCIIFGLFVFATAVLSSPKTTTIGGEPAALFGGAVGGLLLLVYGAFLFIFLYGLGEWMHVFMDIEENTRKTNEMLASRPQGR